LATSTPYPELNDVLRELVAGVREILADNFCGAYLQGSFAVGDADEHSDVDFIVATEDELNDAQVDALQAMHKRLYSLDSTWAQHLEGSYAPRNELRQVDESRPPWWYLDNGATELVRDNHCNTAVVRWSLREKGVVLAGPDPKTLIEPVSAAELRSDVLIALREWADWLGTNPSYSRRAQGVTVLSICRILHTFESGLVTTKREAGEWALGALSPEWASLVQEALDDRPDPWSKVREPVGPDVVRRTLAFVDYAMERTS
jgi:predicted nucleotidyltransferase